MSSVELTEAQFERLVGLLAENRASTETAVNASLQARGGEG